MKFIPYIIIALILGVVVAIMEWPAYVIIIGGIVLALLIISRIVYLSTQSQNLQAIGKFIDGYKKNPVYFSLHMLREGTDEQFKESLHGILKKYKNSKYEAVYGTMLAMMDGDFELAHRYNGPLLHKEVGQYNNYIIDIMAGKEFEEAVPLFSKKWMNASIKAHQAFMKRDVPAFERLSKQAIQEAKGVQYYGNFYTFKRMRKLMES